MLVLPEMSRLVVLVLMVQLLIRHDSTANVISWYKICLTMVKRLFVKRG